MSPSARAGPSWQLQLAAAPVAVAVAGEGSRFALAAFDAALLAWLAIEGPTPRARLAALLWPDSSPESARNSLRQRLFQLRKQTGTELVSGTATLTLADGVGHDLGDADGVLVGLDGAFGGEFVQWLDRQRTQRRDRMQRSLGELAEMAEAAKDWDDALTHAKDLLALDPLSEGAHRRVMRLHYLAGDRAAALLAFDRCEQVLKDEVGARPSAETLALLSTIEQAARPLLATAPAAVPASVLRPPRLIGREREWAAMLEAWDAGRAVVLAGEGGMGKSRLAGDFAAAQPHVLVVGARPGDARVVYASLSRLLRALPSQTLADQPPSLRAELARLLPELGDARPLAGDADRTRFFNAVAAVLQQQAPDGAGIVFDDLHFADDASVELLRYVAGASRLRWIVCARRAEITASGHALLEALDSQAPLVRVDLAPLLPADVKSLLESLDIPGVDAAQMAPALARHTGGNPMYLLESLKAWLQGHGPAGGSAQDAAPAQRLPALRRWPVAPSVTSLIERRIGQLSVRAVQLARCAAVATPDFSIDLAAHVLGLRTLELADPWAELESAQVMRDGGFAHDLIYESALASVPVPVARRLHAEIAAYLEEHGGEPARRAHHWLQAQRWPAAASAFMQAARGALDAGRDGEYCRLLEQAASCFEQAGDSRARFDALRRRAETLVKKDIGDEARRAVMQLHDAAGDDAQRLDAVAARLELANHRIEIEEILQLAPSATQAAHAQGRHDLEIRFVIVWAGALLEQRHMAQTLELLARYRGRAEALADQALHHEFEATCALALMFDGKLRDAVQRNEVCIHLARRLSRPDMLWEDLGRAAGILGLRGRSDEAVVLLRQARAMAMDAGAAGQMRLLQTESTLAHRLRDVGEYAQALPMLEQQLAAYAEQSMENDCAITEHRLAWLFLVLGQPARAKPLLQERASLTAGQSMFRQVLRCELAWHLGRDAAKAVSDALSLLPDRDDVFHRVGSLLAARLVAADEGEAMAASVAHWAARQERLGLAMCAHARAASRAADQGAFARALPHVEAALALEVDFQSETFYIAELWWAAARVYIGLQRDDAARGMLQRAREWVTATARDRVPPAFRDSFLHRNPVNRELLPLAARML